MGVEFDIDAFSQQEIDAGLQAAFAGDKNLRVTFKVVPVLNAFKSSEAGRAIYEDKPFIQIVIPGDRNSTVEREVSEMDKMRFADKWKRFESQMAEPDVGTSLKMVPWVTPSLCAELGYLEIRTVEDMAAMSDAVTGKLMGGNKLREKAIAYLNVSEAESQRSKLEHANEQLQAQLKAMQQQLDQIAAEQAKGKKG